MGHRTEKDFLDEKQIPDDAYYGIQTLRGKENVHITGVPTPLMVPSLLFASSYFSTITPHGGSQNVIFVGSGYLTQGEL